MSLPRSTPAGAVVFTVTALVVAQFAVWGVVRPLWRPDPYSDFATFYSAARCFAAGTDAYDPQALRDTASFGGWIGRYFYPPPFAAVAVRPLVHLPFATARRVWIGIEVAAYVAAVWLATAVAPGLPALSRAALAIALGLAFAPIFLDLRLGSVSGLLLLCAMLALRARARGAPWRAGAWLALAIVLKLAPAVLLVYCGLRREWRLLAGTAATATAVVVLCLPWTGVDAYRTWLVEVVPALLGDSFGWFTNQSLDAFFWRLFVPNPDTTPWVANMAAYRLGVGVTSAALIAIVALGARRAGGAGSMPETLAATTVLAVAPLISRVAWEYLFVLTLPAFFVWAGRAAAGAATRRQVLAIAVAWFLCAAPFAYEQSPPRAGPALLLVAPRTTGAVLLVVVSALALRRQRRTRASL